MSSHQQEHNSEQLQVKNFPKKPILNMLLTFLFKNNYLTKKFTKKDLCKNENIKNFITFLETNSLCVNDSKSKYEGKIFKIPIKIISGGNRLIENNNDYIVYIETEIINKKEYNSFINNKIEDHNKKIDANTSLDYNLQRLQESEENRQELIKKQETMQEELINHNELIQIQETIEQEKKRLTEENTNLKKELSKLQINTDQYNRKIKCDLEQTKKNYKLEITKLNKDKEDQINQKNEYKDLWNERKEEVINWKNKYNEQQKFIDEQQKIIDDQQVEMQKMIDKLKFIDDQKEMKNNHINNK